jgi:hypothetical protein
VMVWADLGDTNGGWQKVVQLDGLKLADIEASVRNWIIV